MIEAQREGDITAGWGGAQVEYLVLEKLPYHDERPLGQSYAFRLAKGLDRLGAEGWIYAGQINVPQGSHFVFFRRVDARAEGENRPG